MQPVDGIVKCGWPLSAFHISKAFWNFVCRISQRLMYLKVVRLSAYASAVFSPQEIFLVLISVRGWVDPRATVWPGGLCQWNIPMTPSGIKPAKKNL